EISSAPLTATADVISSLNDDGSIIVFNFPRVLSGATASSDTNNNSEIYAAVIVARPTFGSLDSIFNAASFGNDLLTLKAIAPDSVVSVRGTALANGTHQTGRLANGSVPTNVAGPT